jgi:hypothetical protein
LRLKLLEKASCLTFKMLAPLLHLQVGNQIANPFRRPAKAVFDAFPHFECAIVLLTVIVLNNTLADDDVTQQQLLILHSAWYASADAGQ